MTPFVTAGLGFLLAVLWFDVMHDVLVRSARGDGNVPDAALASIAGYYRRVTTDARPMNRLVALAMLATLIALIAQVAGTDAPDWAAATTLVLAGGPITLAGTHTVPAAVRLGQRTDEIDQQSRLARAILRDHCICLASVTAAMVVQLAAAR